MWLMISYKLPQSPMKHYNVKSPFEQTSFEVTEIS